MSRRGRSTWQFVVRQLHQNSILASEFRVVSATQSIRKRQMSRVYPSAFRYIYPTPKQRLDMTLNADLDMSLGINLDIDLDASLGVS